MSSLRLSLAVLVVVVVVVHAYSTQPYRPYKREGKKMHSLAVQAMSYHAPGRPYHKQNVYLFSHRRSHHARPKPWYGHKLNKHLRRSRYYEHVQVPLKTRHHIHYRDYPKVEQTHYPQMIEVSAPALPVNIVFRSTSSKMNVHQVHQPAEYEPAKNTYSVDEAHVLKHTITKPVINLVREIIQPKRTITQEVTPVQEEIVTNVADGKTHEYGTRLIPQLEPIVYPAPPAIQSYEPSLPAMSYHLGAGVPFSVSHYSNVFTETKLSPPVLVEQQKLVEPVVNVVPLPEPQPLPPVAQPLPVAEPLPTIYEPYIDLQKIHVDAPHQIAPPQPEGALAYVNYPLVNITPVQPLLAPVAQPVEYKNDNQLLEIYNNFAYSAAKDVELPVYHANPVVVAEKAKDTPGTLTDNTY